MSKFYSKLNSTTKAFIKKQKMFFTAMAPNEGRINLSPKGMDSLRIIDDKTVAYLDLTGSGNETAAHIKNNGRMTIMLCSFTKEPLILRLYGHGRILKPGDTQWPEHIQKYPRYPGTRQIIFLDIESVQTSCGFAIPFYRYEGERNQLVDWATKKGDSGIRKYWEEKNRVSIDGIATGLLDG